MVSGIICLYRIAACIETVEFNLCNTVFDFNFIGGEIVVISRNGKCNIARCVLIKNSFDYDTVAVNWIFGADGQVNFGSCRGDGEFII